MLLAVTVTGIAESKFIDHVDLTKFNFYAQNAQAQRYLERQEEKNYQPIFTPGLSGRRDNIVACVCPSGIPEECFSEWKITLFKSIQEKVKKLKKKIKFKSVKNVLKDPTCLKDLKELKDRFVLVPIDKAANNMGLICKKILFWKYSDRDI